MVITVDLLLLRYDHVGAEMRTKLAIFSFNKELQIIMNNVQCQQQKLFHHSSALLQFNVFSCACTFGKMQQSPQIMCNSDGNLVRWKSLWCVHREFSYESPGKEFWKSVHVCQSYYQTSNSVLNWNTV